MTELPVLMFKYNKITVKFFGFVHGSPPHYKISKALKDRIDKAIKRSNIVFSEGRSRKEFEESIGFQFANPKDRWVALDSNKAIDKLLENVGSEKAIKMLKAIRYAPKRFKEHEKRHSVDPHMSLLLKALKGNNAAIRKLQSQPPVCTGAECLWDDLRNLEWVNKIFSKMYDYRNERKTFFVIGGVGHNEIMSLLENPQRFLNFYQQYYDTLPVKAKRMAKKIMEL